MNQTNYHLPSTNLNELCSPVRVHRNFSLCGPVRIKSIIDKGVNVCANLQPSLLWLEITKKCNLNCLHCYSDSSSSAKVARMTRNDWINCLHSFAAVGGKNVQFTGGEPTLHPNLFELVIAAGKFKFETIEVYTNGTSLNADLLSFFKANSVSIAFSIYGHNSFTHDQITQTPGSFEKTIDGIMHAQNFGLKIRAGVIIVDESIQSVHGICQLLDWLDIKSICMDSIKNVGRGSKLASGNELRCSNSCRHIKKQCVSVNGDIFSCVFQREKKLGNFLNQIRDK